MYDPIVKITTTKCEFCNEAERTNRITSRLDEVFDPEVEALVCARCLQEIQLGHVLKDIYGWSWTKFEGKFVADYPILEPKEVTNELQQSNDT